MPEGLENLLILAVGVIIGGTITVGPQLFNAWRGRHRRNNVMMAQVTMELVRMARARALDDEPAWTNMLRQVTFKATKDPVLLAIASAQLLIQLVRSDDPAKWAQIEQQMEAAARDMARQPDRGDLRP